MRAARLWWIVGAVAGLLAVVAGVVFAVRAKNAPAEASVERSMFVETNPAVLPFGYSAPLATLNWGPTAVDWAKALTTARAMTNEQVAGQVLVASWNSPDPSGARALVDTYDLGGLIFMGDALTSVEAVRVLTDAVSAAQTANGRDWPAVISTDQEGGTVARLEGLVPDLPGFMAAGAASDKSAVTEAYASAGADMVALGFTVDWAPVADVTIGEADPVIRSRSAGTDPANVAATVDAAVAGYLEGGLLPAIKHFPGHGSVVTDSHTGLPSQSATVAQLEARDFIPFQQAIDDGAPMVMLAHIAVAEWGGVPATVSPQAYAYLRDVMGFQGVAVTDAMNMRGVTDAYGAGTAEVAALKAGADLVLFPSDVAVAHSSIVAAIVSGDLPRERVDEAAARVILMMRWQAGLAAVAPAGGTDLNYARDFAAASAVVSSPTCSGPLVEGTVTITGGSPLERQTLQEALATYGIGQGDGTTIRLIGAANGTGAADVVVAMDGPWGIPTSTATTYIGLFGRSDDALWGLADVLAGAAMPTGQWPVPGMPAACAGVASA